MSRVSVDSGMVTSPHTRLRNLFFLATIFGTSIVLLSYRGYTSVFSISDQVIFASFDAFPYDTSDQQSFTIRTEGCSIPALLPLDPSVKEFVEYPHNVKPCNNSKTPLLENNSTHIWISKDNFRYYNVNAINHIQCCYRSFYRPLSVEDITSKSIDDRVVYRKCKFFNTDIKSDDEFVNIVCFVNKKLIYQQYYIFAIEKKLESRSQQSIGFNRSSYNIVILGIDAVSRLNFYRTMPKTLNFLKEKDATELFGYNKVGDNTFPNVIPMLMGIRDTELKRTCVPSSRNTFDNCPFVWQWYKEAGYHTALGEDSSSLGTFNYLKVGFVTSPTDYYTHTFFNEAEQKVGNNKDFNSFLCMNDKYFYTVLLDYVEHLLNKLRSSKLLGFFWEVTMSHDHLNYPMLMDGSYERFFRRLDAQNILDDTFIFLISDHGIRWGNIRATKQGRLEERLPFVFILVPPSFKKTYTEAYNNLRINRHRLTTPFNMHATLNDLIDLKEIQNSKIKQRSKMNFWKDRSVSLFLPIPANRTCAIADIDDHWCTCHRGKKISIENKDVLNAAAYIVEELNSLISEYKVCSKLILAEIINASEMEVGLAENNELTWREFMIVVRTNPGGAVFESTVRNNGHHWSLVGTISRLNLYGQQSHCVNNYHLKLYCYCV